MTRSKYGNVAKDGYASKREAKRAAELRLLERAGKIRNLREQVVYTLIPAQYIAGKCVERACTWKADFAYEEYLPNGVHAHLAGQWRDVVEDAKGYPNDRWAIKRKLMLHVHGVRVREV